MNKNIINSINIIVFIFNIVFCLYFKLTNKLFTFNNYICVKQVESKAMPNIILFYKLDIFYNYNNKKYKI